MRTHKFFRQSGLTIIALAFISLTANCQNDSNPYQGLKDETMVNTLKNFPRKAARWNVPAEDGRLLYDIILKNNYKRVLEVGTSNGYSALWMAYALQETGGELITLEINRERANEARENFEEAGLSSLIDVRLNDALDEIPNLEGTFDLVFLDADKSEYVNYFRMLKPKVNAGGAVAAHNVGTMASSMRDFLESIRNDPDFDVEIREVSSQGVLVGIKKSNNN